MRFSLIDLLICIFLFSGGATLTGLLAFHLRRSGGSGEHVTLKRGLNARTTSNDVAGFDTAGWRWYNIG